MPITKATQNVITPNIVTTDTRQTITAEKVIECLYDTTSTTSLTIGLGSKTLTVGTGLTWVAGRVATIRNGTSTTRFMTASVTSYNSATGVMVVNVTAVGSGTGTYTSWVITQSSSTALPALRITSNDSAANAFVVEDSTNPDSTPFAISSTGSVGIKAAPSSFFDLNLDGNLFASTGLATSGSVDAFNYLHPFTISTGGTANLTTKIFLASSFTIQNDILVTDLVSYFNGLTTLSGVIGDYNRSFSVRALISVFQRSENNTTLVRNCQRATYSANFTVQVYNSDGWVSGSGFTGYSVNTTTAPAQGATTTLNITTAEGSFPTLSPAGSASGYASIIAVRETASANGSLTLTLRSFTGAPTAGVNYITKVGSILDVTVF